MKTTYRILIPMMMLAMMLACLPSTQPVPTATPEATLTRTSLPPTQVPTLTPTESATLPPGWGWFSSSLCRYRIGYPPGVPESGDDATGCYARFDLPVVEGTNLGEKYLEIFARLGETDCKSPLGGGYAPENLQTGIREIGGDLFLVEAGGDAGAGNYYNWTSYTTTRADVCTSLVFMLHSTNVQFYDPPKPEFDWESESVIFEEMVATFEWLAP